MPKTKFQDVVFTILMVLVMVYGMVVYNIALDRGVLDNGAFFTALYELPLMGAAAFVFEMFIAGPLAKKFAFRIVSPEKDRSATVILAISVMTVCFMCPMMSFAATVLFKGADSQIIAKWLQTTALNFPMALCWQIFAAGPFVRMIFNKIFSEKEPQKG